jgi:hypothetical protein
MDIRSTRLYRGWAGAYIVVPSIYPRYASSSRKSGLSDLGDSVRSWLSSHIYCPRAAIKASFVAVAVTVGPARSVKVYFIAETSGLLAIDAGAIHQFSSPPDPMRNSSDLPGRPVSAGEPLGPRETNGDDVRTFTVTVVEEPSRSRGILGCPNVQLTHYRSLIL